jgi:flagellar export protein FliJ
MAFRFTLHSLLRLWRSRERYERRKLEALAARLAALRAERRRVETHAAASRREFGGRLGSGLAGSELHFAAACEENRHTYLRWLREQIEKVEGEHRAQMTAFQSVERQRKIYENLRRRQFETYRIEETRREQKRLDEAFLLTRAATRDAADDPPEPEFRSSEERQR